jgi:putative oxidoreductase
MNARQVLFGTSADSGALVARLTIALVMFPHGAQKVLGWFGGHGFSATMHHFTDSGIPAVFAFLAILAEFAGPIALLFGFLSRVAAFGIAVVMAVAIITVHAKFGFFMNWMGQQPGEGFEYHLLMLGLSLVVMIRGGGRWSVDRALSRPSAG